MTSLRLRATLALAAAAFTAACGGGDGGTGPSFPDSVSTADAQDFADNVASYAGYVASAMNFGGPSVALAGPSAVAQLSKRLPPMAPAFQGVSFRQPDLAMMDWRTATQRARGPQASSAAGCTVTSRGFNDPYMEDPVDLNGNNIPDDLYIKISCVLTDSVGGDTVVTQTTDEEIAVKEITASLYGQTITYDVSQEAHDNHGRYQFIRYNIDGLQDIRAGGVTDKASFKARQETNISGDVVFEEAGQSYNNAFDPDGTITLGNDLPDGALTLAGNQYFADSDGNSLSFGISTPTPLAYDAACALADTNPPFSAGVLHGKLNNNSGQASFDITFTSCGNFDVAVNGAYDEVVVSNHP